MEKSRLKGKNLFLNYPREIQHESLLIDLKLKFHNKFINYIIIGQNNFSTMTLMSFKENVDLKSTNIFNFEGIQGEYKVSTDVSVDILRILQTNNVKIQGECDHPVYLMHQIKEKEKEKETLRNEFINKLQEKEKETLRNEFIHKLQEKEKEFALKEKEIIRNEFQAKLHEIEKEFILYEKEKEIMRNHFQTKLYEHEKELVLKENENQYLKNEFKVKLYEKEKELLLKENEFVHKLQEKGKEIELLKLKEEFINKSYERIKSQNENLMNSFLSIKENIKGNQTENCFDNMLDNISNASEFLITMNDEIKKINDFFENDEINTNENYNNGNNSKDYTNKSK